MDRVTRNPDLFLIPARGPRWTIRGTVGAGDEIPMEIPKCAAILVSPKGRATWIAFDCPCNLGHRIMLNLDPRRYPSWRLVRKDPLTVSPSVNISASGRHCHFFLWKAQILWVRSSPQRRRS